MKILFALSQKELTGAETYAISVIEALKAKGVKTCLVSDTLTCEIDVPYYPLDLDNRASPFNRMRHIMTLVKIIKKERIALIHAHSRASSWPSYFASRLTHIPLITTAHCIYPVHLSSRLFPCFGEKVIAICPAVRDHLIRDFGVNSQDIVLIPNGIDTDRFRPEAGQQEIVISWIGRFSGPRGKLIEIMVEKIVRVVRKAIPYLKLLIVAGGRRPFSLEKKVSAINSQFGNEVIKFTGFRRDIPEILADSNLIIGAGRVVLEAMACGRPVVALGEKQTLGLITPENLSDGIYTNFGDCCQGKEVEWDNLALSIIELLKNKKDAERLGKWGRNVVLAQFEIGRVTGEIEEVYKSAME
ncbi:glycosyltransferase [bacterium]|nr:glycosyltransferase [bacterium]MBU2462147.1 glycosyltransferase [bacterium]